MISVEEAFNYIRKNVQPTTDTEERNVLESVGYVLSEDVFSAISMPPFRQSAMDGYALCIHESLDYKVIDEVKAGDGHHPSLKQGEAVRIFTGAAVPDTADVVIMQEKVTVNNTHITIEHSVPKGDNVRPLGEQVLEGGLALAKDTVLVPASIGYLLSLGITKIKVYKRPKVSIVVTGSELVEAGNALSYGQIYESNSGMLLMALNSLGYTDVNIHKVGDDYLSTKNMLDEVIDQNDIVVITGGISVGDYDFVGKALLELAVEQLFYKVKQKPGKPLFYGKKNETNIFALPGNPAAALSCFYLYVRLALNLSSGNTNFSITKEKIKSASDYTKKGIRAQFLKAILSDGNVQILLGQSSAMLQTFALANALVYVPSDLYEIKKGDLVEVIRLPV